MSLSVLGSAGKKGRRMIYFENDDIVIRDMISSDAQTITAEEIKQGWNQTTEKYEMRLKHQSEGIAYAIVAEYKRKVAGYISVYLNPNDGAFAHQGIPEIVDLGVLEKYRRKGIGSKLMDVAESIAAKFSDTVCLSVGLHNGYGAAQRMYVKRGYIPDGSGVWYGTRVCPQYESCCNDDDLVLFFSRRLDVNQGNQEPGRNQGTVL